MFDPQGTAIFSCLQISSISKSLPGRARPSPEAREDGKSNESAENTKMLEIISHGFLFIQREYRKEYAANNLYKDTYL